MEATRNLSNNVSALRAIRRLSQVEFSKELGISKSTLQEIEQGHSPNLSTVECIANHLNMPVSTLISDALPPEQMSTLVYLLHTCGWYSGWSPEDRDSFLSLACQLCQILSKYAPDTVHGT